MARIYFVHWNEQELQDLAVPLRAEGHEVFGHHYQNRAARWDGFEPDVVAISLERLPSHGRAIAHWVASSKKRRATPVVFVGGKKDKAAELKTEFPSGVFCSFAAMSRTIAAILAGKRKTAPLELPTRSTAAISGTPLAKKLGINDRVRYALVDPPDGFDRTLAAPQDSSKAKRPDNECNVLVLFARTAAVLNAELEKLGAALAPTASLWLAWPKKTSALAGDLSDEVVRQIGLRAGLVDVKVCSIDETWSGLKFMHRVKDRPRPSKKAKRGT
jgi:hypothetical protein